jgi:putative transposase
VSVRSGVHIKRDALAEQRVLGQCLTSAQGRGLKQPRLFVGDGNLGLWAAVSEVYPQAQQQLCWNHKMLNVIDTVSRKEQSQVKRHLQAMMYAERAANRR